MDELAYTRKKIPGFKTLAEEQAREQASKIKGPITNADIAAEMLQNRSQQPAGYISQQQPYNPSTPKDFKSPSSLNAQVSKAPVAVPDVVPEATPAVVPEAAPAVVPEATPAVVPDATSVAPDFVPAIPPKSTVSKLSQSEGASAPMSDRKGMDLSGIASFLGDAGGNVMKALTSPEARGALADILGIYGQSRSAAAGQTETNPIFLRKQREFELAKQAKELENQRTLLGTQTETQKAMQTKSLELEKLLGLAGLDQQTVNKILDIFNSQNAIETQQRGQYGTGPNTQSSFLQNFYAPGGIQAQANQQGLNQSNALQVQGIRNLLRFAPQLMSQISGSSGGYQDPLTAAAQGIGQNPGSIWNLNMPNMNSLGQQTFGNNLSLFNTARGMMPSGGGNEPVRQ
jgi:hypothetical protein